MSTTKPAHAFRVIEGGASTKTPAAPQGSKSDMQQEHLRQAILRLPVEGLGMTVQEVLQEISDKLDTGEDADFARWVILSNKLEDYGLRFMVARPEMNLVREGYLILAWPDRLVRYFPQLAELYAEAHPSMVVG